ncbi:hypothetical protein BGZ65_000017 [Modicella reniformis]|uniref:Uncharacterized protein n=1 Tax=Modicella reniformis TaxID=1440133 RepID=A0A9P6J2R2_9FUNG|nr:hypothetical protein BGZ65_000017 [Modicella reniformis]
MSFIYNYFFNDNFTPAERENAAALKAMINDHKSTLKTEYKQYESEYKQTVKDAEATYKRAKEQAKQDMERKTLDAVKREVDIILTTDEFSNSDAKTKAKVEGFVSWMNGEFESRDQCRDDHKAATFADEKQPDLISV